MEEFKQVLREYSPLLFKFLKFINRLRHWILRYFDGKRIKRHNQLVNAVAEELYAHFGNSILQGPFQGMNLPLHRSYHWHPTYLCGTYELELHHFFTVKSLQQYEYFLNVGCACGYYAVGMARQCPETLTLAYDINSLIIEQARALATANQCNNIEFRGLFEIGDLCALAPQRCFVLCDIEGGEKDLFTQVPSSELRHCDFLIETHDFYVDGVTDALVSHFEDTHEVEHYKGCVRNPENYPHLNFLGPDKIGYALDVARHETGRWLFLRAKSAN